METSGDLQKPHKYATFKLPSSLTELAYGGEALGNLNCLQN